MKELILSCEALQVMTALYCVFKSPCHSSNTEFMVCLPDPGPQQNAYSVYYVNIVI